MNVNIYSSGESPLLQIRYMGCNRLPDTVSIGPMLRNSYIIHYVTKGRGYYNGTLVEAGMGFLIYPGHIEHYWSDPESPWELLWVVSEDPNMEKLFQIFLADPETQVFSFDYMEAVCRTRDALCMIHNQVVSRASLLELFLSVFKYHDRTVIQQSGRPKSELYAEFAIRYIHENYQNILTIQSLTELLHISRPYLFRIFKDATGQAPKQYLSDYRLLQAKKFLTETSMTITEVANSVGFGDVLAFSKFFSEKTGGSPKSYRNNNIPL